MKNSIKRNQDGSPRIKSIADLDYRIIWDGVKRGDSAKQIAFNMPHYIYDDGETRPWSYNGIYNWVLDCKQYRKSKGKRGGSFIEWLPSSKPYTVATRKPKLVKPYGTRDLPNTNIRKPTVRIPVEEVMDEYQRADAIIEELTGNRVQEKTPIISKPIQIAVEALIKLVGEVTDKMLENTTHIDILVLEQNALADKLIDCNTAIDILTGLSSQ